MKIYISGPITNDKDYLEKFAKAETELRLQGVEVVNPAEILFTMPKSTTHSQYMIVSLALLSQCDAVYMLKGWQKSKGANIEFEYAYEHGITIAFEGGAVWHENQSDQKPQTLQAAQG